VYEGPWKKDSPNGHTFSKVSLVVTSHGQSTDALTFENFSGLHRHGSFSFTSGADYEGDFVDGDLFFFKFDFFSLEALITRAVLSMVIYLFF
jgi:hypothetical protein